MKPIKINTPTYQEFWDKLQPIFLNDYKGVDKKIIRELKKIGIEVYGTTHPKIKILNKVVVLTKSSSTIQTGRTILRTIRKILEQEDKLWLDTLTLLTN